MSLLGIRAFLKAYGVQLGVGLAVILAVWFIYHKGEVAAEHRAEVAEQKRQAMERNINAQIGAALRQQMADLDARFQAEREKQAALAAEVRTNIEKEIARDPHLSQPGAVPRSVLDQLNRIH